MSTLRAASKLIGKEPLGSCAGHCSTAAHTHPWARPVLQVIHPCTTDSTRPGALHRITSPRIPHITLPRGPGSFEARYRTHITTLCCPARQHNLTYVDISHRRRTSRRRTTRPASPAPPRLHLRTVRSERQAERNRSAHNVLPSHPSGLEYLEGPRPLIIQRNHRGSAGSEAEGRISKRPRQHTTPGKKTKRPRQVREPLFAPPSNPSLRSRVFLDPRSHPHPHPDPQVQIFNPRPAQQPATRERTPTSQPRASVESPPAHVPRRPCCFLVVLPPSRALVGFLI